VAVTLGLLGAMVVGAAQQAQAAPTVTPAANPSFPAKCGLSIALVFDLSASISATQLTQMKQAGDTLVSSLADTPSSVGVFTFASYAPAYNGGRSLVPAGNDTLHALPLSVPANVKTVTDHINGLTLPSAVNGYTNWDRGLRQVADDEHNGPHYDAVLFITDGDPTVSGNPPNTTGANPNNVRDVDMDAAISSANALKAQGTRVVAINVANSQPGSASVQRLQMISGPTENSDYFHVSFAGLGALLASVSTENCQGTLTVVKRISVPGDPNPPRLEGGWTFHATPNAEGQNVAVSGTTNNDVSNPAYGTVNFEMPKGSATTATVTEDQKEDSRILPQDGKNAACQSDGVPVTTVANTALGFTVPVEPTAIVTCTVVNEVIPAQLTLRKVVHNIAGSGLAQTDDWTLHARGEGLAVDALTGNDTGSGVGGGILPGEYTLSESGGPAGYTASAWSCTGQGSGDLSGADLTLHPGDDVTCTITNTENPVITLVQDKTVDKPIAETGDTVAYTVTVQNTGNGTATGLAGTDTLPNGVTFVSASPSNGAYDAATGVWTIGNLAAGASATLTITATVAASAPAGGDDVTLTNRFQVTTPPGGGITVENACTDNDAQSCAETTVPAPAPAPQLTQAKAVDKTIADVGDTVAYTVEVANTGNTALTGITATDSLPPGITFVAATPSVGVYDAATGVWTIGNLAVGGEATLTITGRVAAGAEATTQTNRFQVTTPSGADVVVENACTDNPDQSCAQIEIPGVPALTQAKSVDKATAAAGDHLDYTMTVHNSGTAADDDVVAHDTLPANVTYVSSDTHGHGTYDSTTGLWDIGAIAIGQTVTLTITVAVEPEAEASTLTNRFHVVDPPSGDITVENACADDDAESCAETTVPGVPRLTQTKTVDAYEAVAGETVRYGMTIANTGTAPATGVTAHDTLPPRVSFVSADTGGAGVFDAATGTWAVGDIAPGHTVTLIITAKINAGVEAVLHVNRFAVTPPPGTPPVTIENECPDQATASCAYTYTPGIPRLEQNKTVDKTSAAVGDTLTYAITVTNRGTGESDPTIVRDLLPAGLRFVSATTDGLSFFDSATLTWTLPVLIPGATAHLTLTATALPSAAGNALTNKLVVTPPPGSDPNVVDNQCPNDPNDSCAVSDISAETPLPNTGVDSRDLGGIALLLLIIGAALALAGRRRSSR
jgi:uncharacterized repeat protein (TIGR01451 family)